MKSLRNFTVLGKWSPCAQWNLRYAMHCSYPNKTFNTKTSINITQTRDKMTQVHTHTHPFNGPFSGTTQASRYQKDKTNLDFTEARDSEWQWHHISWAICKSAPRSRQITTPALHYSSFLQAGCPSWRPTNSVKALKAHANITSCE